MAKATVQDQLKVLELQGLDTKNLQLNHRKTNHPTNARLTELAGQTADLADALATSQSALNDLKRELTKAEGDVEQVRQRITRNQSRLDSGQVSAKDAQAILSELESLAQRAGVLEDIQLDVMMRLEAHESALTELQSAHQSLVAARAEVEAERASDFAKLDAELADLAAARTALSEELSPEFLELYERLRTKNDGIGAAALRHGKSEASGLDIPATELERIKELPLDEVVFCEETGAILVRVADLKDA